MADNRFTETINSLFKGVDSLITTKTVVGDAVRFDDGTVILPLVDVSFGMGAGAWAKDENRDSAGGGLGGKMTPSAVIVIKDGHTKLVNIKNQDVATKILDLVPEVVDKVTTTIKEKKEMKEKIDSVFEEDDNK